MNGDELSSPERVIDQWCHRSFRYSNFQREYYGTFTSDKINLPLPSPDDDGSVIIDSTATVIDGAQMSPESITFDEAMLISGDDLIERAHNFKRQLIGEKKEKQS